MQEDRSPSNQHHAHHTPSDNKPDQAAPAPGHARDGMETSEQTIPRQGSEHQQMKHAQHDITSGDSRDELDHASMGHGGMHYMESRATGPQKFVVGLASVLALVEEQGGGGLTLIINVTP
jgi:hypothetical protein